MSVIFFTRLNKARLGLEVVVAVGQAEAGGGEIGNRLAGIVIVGTGAQAEGHGDGNIMQLAEDALQVGGCLHAIDLGKQRLRRRQTKLVGASFIHAGDVIIADKLFHAAALPIAAARNFFQDLLQAIFGGFAGCPAPAPAGHRRRYG